MNLGGPDDVAGPPAVESLMTIRVTERRDAVVIGVHGEVDVLTDPRLEESIATAFDDLAGRVLVVDLSDVTFLGGTGLHTLVDSARAARHRGTLRVVVDHARPVIRPIEIAGLDDLLALFHTVDEAIAG